MGGFLTALLQGVGRTGNEAAEGQDIAKRSRFEEEDRKLKLLQSQLGLSEVQQKLKMNAAPQYVGSHADPTGQLFNTQRDPFTGTLTDQAGGKEAGKGVFKPLLTEDGDYVLYNDVTKETQPMKDEKGSVIRGFPKGKSGPLIINGKPSGVYRGGVPYTPSDPGWTPEMAVQLASYVKTYGEGEEDKKKRIDRAAQARTDAFLRSRMYGVMDAATGSLVMVPADDIKNNPGRYSPAGPAVTAKNRDSIFKEIDTTKGFLRDAITALPNDAFDAEARAQIAYVLKDTNPKSAWDEFKQSEVAKHLTGEQIDYVTSLVSMNESAMSLRSVAGMGAGSDMLRGAIQKMLPGASTPSKAYALRQLKIFEGELQALRTSVPGIGAPGQGGGQTKGQGNQDPMKLFTP